MCRVCTHWYKQVAPTGTSMEVLASDPTGLQQGHQWPAVSTLLPFSAPASSRTGLRLAQELRQKTTEKRVKLKRTTASYAMTTSLRSLREDVPVELVSAVEMPLLPFE